MKSTVACLILAFVGFSSATTNLYPRGCIYANGRCVQECPVGTQSYTIGCGYVVPEATCRNSRPKPSTKQTCGYSACHCVSPTVRNEATGQCVHLDKCPGAKIIKTHGGGGTRRIERRPLSHLKPLVAPRVPVRPTAPVVPVKPVAPQIPVVQQIPVQVPQIPVVQQIPVQVPQKPVAPQIPVAPVKPAAPTAPVVPSVPVGYNNYNSAYNSNSGYNRQPAYNSQLGYNSQPGYNNAVPL